MGGDNNKARELIKKQLKINEEIGEKDRWIWVYRGLIMPEKRDDSLLKALECTKRNQLADTIHMLNKIKRREPGDKEFYDTFKEMLENKIESN